MRRCHQQDWQDDQQEDDVHHEQHLRIDKLPSPIAGQEVVHKYGHPSTVFTKADLRKIFLWTTTVFVGSHISMYIQHLWKVWPDKRPPCKAPWSRGSGGQVPRALGHFLFKWKKIITKIITKIIIKIISKAEHLREPPELREANSFQEHLDWCRLGGDFGKLTCESKK